MPVKTNGLFAGIFGTIAALIDGQTDNARSFAARSGKKILSVVVTLAVAAGMIPAVSSPVQAWGDYWKDFIGYDYSWYTGHEADATLYLTSVEDLVGFSDVVNGDNYGTPTDFYGKTIVLTVPVNLTGHNWTPIGTQGTPFRGTFDGGSIQISNLQTDSAASQYRGLFGYSEGVIQNVILINAAVTGTNFVGGIAGFAKTVSGCSSSGSVTGSGWYVGGIVGANGDPSDSSGTVQNCSNASTVSGSTYVGGLGGYVSRATNCSNAGAVSGSSNVGGIAGLSGMNRTFSNTYNTGSITASTDYVGGILAFGSGPVLSSYNTGSVRGQSNVGGIVGYSNYSVEKCYSTGLITGTSYKGAIAGNIYAPVLNTYYYGCAAAVGSQGYSVDATPFVKLVSASIPIGGTTTITQNNAAAGIPTALGSNLLTSYSGFTSPIAAITGTTVTGISGGTSSVAGTMIITQNELTASGFTGPVKQIIVPISLPLTVTKASPGITASSSSASCTVGDSITLSAVITAGVNPTGMVTFKNNGTVIGSTSTITGGTASIPYTTTAAGALSVTASYSGDASNNAAVSAPAVNVTVNKEQPAVSVAVSPISPVNYPTAVGLTATLSNFYGLISGQNISFYQGAELIGQGTTDGDGKASITWVDPGAGSYSITALYAGNSYNMSAASAGSPYNVNKGAQTAVSISGVPGTVIYGDVPFTLGITGGSGTGAVSYSVETGKEGVITVDADSGTVTVHGAGTAQLTVSKAGDANYYPISSVTTITVLPKVLTVTSTAVENKIYDGNYSAAFTAAPTLTGVVPGDEGGVTLISGTPAFTDKNYSASAISVTFTAFTLDGVKKDNYSLTQPGSVSAYITKRPLDVSVEPVTIYCGQAIPLLTVTVDAADFAAGENESITGFAVPMAATSYGSTDIVVISDVMNVSYSGGDATDNYYFVGDTTSTITINPVAVLEGDYLVTGNYGLTANPVGWNTTDIVITPANGYSTLSVDGLNWVPSITQSGEIKNGSITFMLRKNDGTKTGTTTIYYNIDKTLPLISAAGDTNNYKQSDIVTVAATAGVSGIVKVEVQKGAGSFTDITASFASGCTIAENDTYTFRVTNGAGVSRTAELTYDKIDNVQPVAAINPNGYTEGSWTNQSVTLTVTNTAANIGPESFEVSTDGIHFTAFGGTYIITGDSSIEYFFRVISASGVVGEAETFTVSLDRTAPSGSINIETNSFTQFLNTITFGLFFNETVDVSIIGEDSASLVINSGVTSIEYQKVADQADYSPMGVWTADNSFSAAPDDKFITYARISDAAGNVTIINSDGVVVYTNSLLSQTAVLFDTNTEKSGYTDIHVDLSPIGNTVKEIALGSDVLTRNTDYTISGSTVTIKKEYLKTVVSGTITLTFIFNPLGEVYVNGDVPAAAELAVTEVIHAAVPSFTSNLTGQKTYSIHSAADELRVAASAADSGIVTFQWYISDTAAGNGTAVIGADGVSLTPKTDANGVFYYYVIATNTNSTVNGEQISEAISGRMKIVVNSITVLPPEISSGAPAATLSDETVSVIQSVITEADKEKLAAGSSISICVKITKPDIPQADKDAALKALGGNTLAELLDISLVKTTDGVETKITQTNSPIRITMEIPAEMRKNDRSFAIVRIHNGIAVVLTDLDSNPDTITFETNSFSTYAIIYTDAALPAVKNEDTAATTAPVKNAGKEGSATAAKTGEKTSGVPLYLLGCAALAAGLYISKRRRNQILSDKKTMS